MKINEILSWVQSYILQHYEMYVRVAVSALLGFIIGWDRGSKSKPAGLKTYMYVSVASTLITLVSIHSVIHYSHLSDRIMMDPMRLTAQIVSGLGFLGAGVILKNGLQVRGLTSAAMILFVGGVGIGIGAGFYGLVLFSVIISMVMAKIGNTIEKRKFNIEATDEAIHSEITQDD